MVGVIVRIKAWVANERPRANPVSSRGTSFVKIELVMTPNNAPPKTSGIVITQRCITLELKNYNKRRNHHVSWLQDTSGLQKLYPIVSCKIFIAPLSHSPKACSPTNIKSWLEPTCSFHSVVLLRNQHQNLVRARKQHIK